MLVGFVGLLMASEVGLVVCGVCGRWSLNGIVDVVGGGGVSVGSSRFIESPGRPCVH